MGVNILSQQTFDGKGIVTASFEDDYITRGNRFEFTGKISLGASGSQKFLVDLSSVPKGKFIYVTPVVFESSATEVDFILYEDTDYTGGTSVTGYNRNRNFGDTYNFVVTTGATGSDKGTAILTRTAFGSTAAPGLGSTSRSGVATAAIVLDTSKNYLVEFVNIDTGTATKVTFDEAVYEV